jgi:hypothetical protein
MLIVDPLPVSDVVETLSSQRVPVEALQAGMRAVLADIGRMFSDAEAALGRCRLDEIEISLAISADGSIGLLGTQIKTGAKGAIKLKLKVEKAP